MNDREVYETALNWYGPEAQTLMVLEEMSELQKELCKNARGKDNRKEIAEEIADVRIMLDRMEILHNCEGLAVAIKRQKIERLECRIHKENNDKNGINGTDGMRRKNKMDKCTMNEANRPAQEVLYTPRYRCRICGKEFDGTSIYAEYETKICMWNAEYEAEICTWNAVHGKETLNFNGLYAGHECTNESLGIADFIGFRRESGAEK